MPRSSNGHRHVVQTTPSPGVVSQRLARRANGVEDPCRLKLLTAILEESSSPTLNDVASQQLGPRQVAENHFRLLDLLEDLRRLELASNPKLPVRDEESWSRFFSWVDDEVASDVSKKVRVAKRLADVGGNISIDDENEYSLVAKVPFKKGDKIFNIDRKLLLSTETASKDTDLNEFIKKDSIASGMQNVVLVLHLLNEFSKREQSYWWPYLSILPNKILPVLRLNKQSLLKCLIASSHIYEALKLLRSIARQYSYFYQRLHATRLPLRKDFTFEYYAWGVSCVCSRQNEIPLGVGGPASRELKYPGLHHNAHALIPILDMCNHDSRSNQALFLDNASCLVANKELKSGDEITINYGSQSRSCGEFYIHNGFVPDLFSPESLRNDQTKGPTETPVSSYHDVVPITIGLSKNNKLYDRKAKLLKILNMPTFGRFRLILNTHENRHKRDPHLSMFLIVYSLSESELDLVLNDANPVGVADEIYECVHHKIDQSSHDDKPSERNAMKRRIAKSVDDYLSLRASVSIALIDRTLEEAVKSGTGLDPHAVRLLRSERRIFESYTSCHGTMNRD